MKTTSTVLMAIAVCLLIITSGCKKASTTADPNAKQHNEDVNNTKGESNNLNTDVNNELSNVGFGKNFATQAASICGATIDVSHQFDAQPSITITFDGITTCSNRIRSGIVTVTLIHGAHWRDQDAVLQITHTNYKVVFTNLNNHYVTFNGTKYLTDVTGIDYSTYLSSGAVTAQYRERSNNLTVTFENGQTASWNIARLTTWSVTGYTNIAATVNGDSTSGGKTIDSWGVTRWGTSFTTEMVQPWQSNSTCGWWKPTAGKYTSTTDNFSVTATFGVDQSGNQVSASGCTAYGLKLDWTVVQPNSTGSAIVQYW